MFVKLLGLFLIRCVFTKKILAGQKFVKTEARKNRGFPEHCALSTPLINDLFEFEPVVYSSITLFQILTTTTAHSSPHQQITRDKPCG